MTQLLFNHDGLVREWVALQLPYNSAFQNSVAIGVIDGEQIIAGVVYTPFRQGDMEMSVAAREKARWLTKGNLFAFFAYPFIMADCRRVTSIIPARNTRSRKFCGKLGFTLEGYHKRAFADDDAISYGLLRQDCKWIPEDVEFQGRTRSAAGS